MNQLKFITLLTSAFYVLAGASFSYAANEDVASTSTTLGIFKTLLGLLVVLAVMAGVAWIAKRMVGQANSAHSVARIIGGVSVGNRERVVVIEVGKRWLVVGVAAGHISAIANLAEEDRVPCDAPDHDAAETETLSFAARLKQSLLRPQA